MHRRRQIAVRNALRHVEARKEYLLDHLAARIAELGLERHGGLFIEPQPIAEAELILGIDRDDSRGAPEDVRRRQRLDAIELVHIAPNCGSEPRNGP